MAADGLGDLAAAPAHKNYPVTVVTSNPSLLHFGPFSVSDPLVLSSWTSGHTTWWRIIPVSRFWPMQFIESGWLLALSVLLIAATAVLVKRRAT